MTVLEIGLPTLIIHGADEEPSIAEAARRLHAAMPGSRYVVVPGAEHFVQHDNPAGLNGALADFLRAL